MADYLTQDSLYSYPPRWNYMPSFTMPPMYTSTLPPLFDFTTPMFENPIPTSTVQTTTPAVTKTKTTAEILKEQQQAQNEAYEKAYNEQLIAQDRKNNGYIDVVNNEIKVDEKTRKGMEEDSLNNLEEENKAARTNLGASLAMGSVFYLSSIKNGMKVNTNSSVTNVFFAEAGGKAKYAKLYKDAPTVMLEAQEELAKVHRDYQKQLKRYKANGSSTTELTKSYKDIVTKMEKALKTGNPDEVAKVTHKIKETKGTWQRIKCTFRATAPRIEDRAKKMRIVKTTDVKAKTGNSFLKNAGGKTGFGMAGAMAGLSLACDYSKIKAGFEKDFETGMTQLGQSALTATVPAGVYFVSDAAGKTIVNKAVSKGAGKIATGLAKNTATKASTWFTKQAGKKIIGKACAKIGTKLAGRAIGTAIGSLLPGVGTVLGFAIGCVADWAIQKWLMPHSDVTDKNNIATKSDKDLLTEAYIRKAQGQKIDERTEKLLTNNPELCQQIEYEIMQAQQQNVA